MDLVLQDEPEKALRPAAPLLRRLEERLAVVGLPGGGMGEQRQQSHKWSLHGCNGVPRTRLIERLRKKSAISRRSQCLSVHLRK